MNPNPITRINGIDIVTVEKDGETYLPVTPICNAIGIDAKAQRDKIQNDEFFGTSRGAQPLGWCRWQEV